MSKRSPRVVFLATAFVAALVAAPNARAEYFCQGPVVAAGITPDGGVYAHSPVAGLRYVRLCSISTASPGITVDACKGILATLLTAQTTAASVQWAFNDTLTCTTHPDWANLTGWYWGPFLVPQ